MYVQLFITSRVLVCLLSVFLVLKYMKFVPCLGARHDFMFLADQLRYESHRAFSLSYRFVLFI